MFEQSQLDGRGKTRRPLTFALSLALQVGFVAIAIVVPMALPDAIPVAKAAVVGITAPPPPPPPAAPAAPAPKVKPTPKVFDPTKFHAPKDIPKEVALIKDEEIPVVDQNQGKGVFGGVPGGKEGGVLNSIIDKVTENVAPPPKPPEPKVIKPAEPQPPQRVTVGGRVKQPQIVRMVKPLYPKLARDARVQGTVTFTGVISTTGRVMNLTLVSGHALLVQAAMEAVRQWEYQPSQLNEQPVEVVAKIDVNFTLSQ